MYLKVKDFQSNGLKESNYFIQSLQLNPKSLLNGFSCQFTGLESLLISVYGGSSDKLKLTEKTVNEFQFPKLKIFSVRETSGLFFREQVSWYLPHSFNFCVDLNSFPGKNGLHFPEEIGLLKH